MSSDDNRRASTFTQSTICVSSAPLSGFQFNPTRLSKVDATHSGEFLHFLLLLVGPSPPPPFRRGTEPSYVSTPRRVGSSRRVVEEASEEEADSQGDYNGTRSTD